jgi:capsular exopolysaccharide synthesis family protein
MGIKTRSKGSKKNSSRRGGLKKLPRLDSEMNFEAKEAFNLLRTNLMLSFPDLQKGRVIGVSSSVSGEGKSFVSCCIAQALAKTGSKVLLLEGDLRLPTVAKKLDIKKTPGLSNLLAGSISEVTDVLQRKVYGNLDVITSGDIPPNPSELLGSQRMKSLIGLLSQNYDYIIFDLPPVTSVPDALVVSSLTNGMILVVRHEYTDKNSVGEAIRQLKIADAKILGFVYNDNDERNPTYVKKYYGGGKYQKYSSYAGSGK